MARKNDDNFYRRQQEEANRLAATQNRHLNEIAKLTKSGVEEVRKMRRAFETFAEAMLGMKIEPFQGAVPSEAARGQIAEFDIKGFEEALADGEALTIPGSDLGPTTPYTIAKGPAPEGSPYPHVDITPKPGQPVKTKVVRLGYGDVIEANDDFIKTEHASGKGGSELADLGLVIGVDLAQEDPAQYALIATRRAVESNDRLVVICDELATRELLLAVEHEVAIVSNDGYDGETTNDLQRQALVERVREKIESQRVTGEIMRVVNETSVRRARNQGSPDDLLIVVLDAAKPGEAIPLRRADLNKVTPAYVLDDPADGKGGLAVVDEAPAGTVEAAIQEAIDNGEHPPALDGLDVIDDSDLPACGFCGDNVGLPECPAHGEVLPPGVTPKMMADHPEFAERVRSTPHYHQANQEASKRTHEMRLLPDGTGILPTEPGEDIPVTMNGKEIGRATINEDGTGTVSIDGDKALPTVASGGYTGVGLSESVVGGIVHQGIFSDMATHEKSVRALSQYAADAERQRQRRDGLASY